MDRDGPGRRPQALEPRAGRRGSPLRLGRAVVRPGRLGPVCRLVHRHRTDALLQVLAVARRRVPPLLLLLLLRHGGRAVAASNLGDREDGLPPVLALAAGRRVSEPPGHERALRPAVADACDVPVDGVRGRVAVQLVPHVDELLHAADVDVVDAAEVENHGLERGHVRVLACDVEVATAALRLLQLPLRRAGVVPRPVARPRVLRQVRAARVRKDVPRQVLERVRGVGVAEALGEAVDEDARVRALDLDVRVGAVAVVDGQEDVSGRGAAGARSALAKGAVLAVVVADDPVVEDRVHPDGAQEAAARLEDAAEEDRRRDGDGGVDAVLDVGEDGDDDTDEEYHDFDRRDAPELVQGVRGRDQIAHGVDDDRGERCTWDVVKDGRQDVDGQEHHDGSDDTRKRRISFRILNFGFDRWFMLTNQLIMVYSKITKTVLSVPKKK
ncbi:hypothetical protein PpBr36_05415 [Pyricularia pennisetigena]|uniref:hypothetical protein n=1 Tax=Pyricularia pennisetigena TaxID=1578925 RepID=UPI00114DA561|nr:hypothetical protein PpBr36_05415 [Pyricularia pennisetigena]TLS26770.1 hypothetical protein PpBr36_05415 [Pyricularia pennisetigena]